MTYEFTKDDDGCDVDFDLDPLTVLDYSSREAARLTVTTERICIET